MKIQFYDNDLNFNVILKDVVDDGTQIIEIPTPEGWKCERENCHMDYLHTHGTYSTLLEVENSLDFKKTVLE